jgi:RNA polymerase sigma-70 factor (ECF subfamily)
MVSGDLASATSDAIELIGRMARGDRSGLEGLYDRYAQLLFNLVVRIVGNRPDAEEVLQEVFLQAWRSASHYDRARGTPEAWLIMMARTRAIDLLRAARRTLARPEAEPMPEVPAPTADTGGALEARAAVTSALQDLTPAQREVLELAFLELAFYEGLSQTEIAIRTGSPLGTVKTRTRMALERLRQTFLMKGWSR